LDWAERHGAQVRPLRRFGDSGFGFPVSRVLLVPL